MPTSRKKSWGTTAQGHEEWHEPAELLATVEALRTRLLDAKNLPSLKETVGKKLIDELEGCIVKAKSAIADGANVHLCVVM